MAKKQAQPTSLLISLAGPAVILCAYVANTRLNPSETASQIVRLQEDLISVKASEVSLQDKLGVVENLRVKSEQLASATAQLDQLRRRAGDLMRGEVSSMDQLKSGSEVHRVLTVAGMRLVNEHPVASQSSRRGMLGTLADATQELGETLTELASAEAENVPIQLPPNLPLDINPIEWMAQQRALRVGNFNGPVTRSSEIKLVGDYRSMVAGLEAVVDTCPGVVVTSVAFQKPAIQTAAPAPLIWDVQLQIRPMPSTSNSSPSGEMTARAEPVSRSVVLESGGAAMGPSIAGPRDQWLPNDQTYMVAKPVLGEGD